MKRRSINTLIVVPLAILMPACTQAVEKTPAVETVETKGLSDYGALLPNARQPIDGVLSGGQPSPAQLEMAKEAGFRTVINLRTPGEPGSGQEDVEALEMEYVSLPIAGANGLTLENTQAFADALEKAEKPVLLHCASGNRVGALFALKAFHLDGKSAEEALEIGKASGLTRLEKAVQEHLAAASSE